jgi:hypothetical protein
VRLVFHSPSEARVFLQHHAFGTPDAGETELHDWEGKRSLA